MSEIHPRAWAGEDAPPSAQGDIDAVLARVRDITQGDGAKIAAHIDAQAAEIAKLRARVEALTEALREARVLAEEVADFVGDHGIHRYGGAAALVRDRIRAALAGKE